jgi:hypothetical protein
VARTILLFHIISDRPPKQPCMVRTFLKVHTRPRLTYALLCSCIPPNRQPTTVRQEERGGRGTTSRLTSTRAPPELRPPLTTRHASPPRTSTSPLPIDKTHPTDHTSR